MHILPQYDSAITLHNIGKGHRYRVEGVSCNACANCRKGKPCIGLPSVTTITGKYTDGDMYGAGYRAALNAVFGQIDSHQGHRLDVERWLKGLEFTADRVGLIFTNSLEHALHIIDRNPASLSLSTKEECALALRAFSCSESYFQIRQVVGHSID